MDSVLLWTAITFVAVFAVILGMEWLLSAGADEDDWWRTKEAWIQPLIGAGAVAGIVFVVWMVLRGIGA